MKENSKEEDIKIIENLKEAINSGLCYFGSVTMYDCGYQEALEHILSDYKRVLKENEYMHNELNKQQTTINKYAKENEELKRLHIQDNKHLDFIMEHSIPVQKVRDKIRYYQELQDNYIKKYDEINEGLQAMINVLQELLEGRK